MTYKRHRSKAAPLLTLLLAWALLFALFVNRANTQDRDDPPPTLVEGAPTDVATLVKTTHTSAYNPPSPDPAGVTYLPASRSLLIADSEVNEIENLFTGDNLFEASLGGQLLDTMTTVPFSDEPTGVTVNPDNGHYFFSDDSGTAGFYEVNPGPDGISGTLDDTVTFVNSEELGATDPEGIAFQTNTGRLFIANGADGLGTESIHIVDPGANGAFDGAPPDGDDTVTSFDALALGIRDPEGLAFNFDNDNLYILSGRDSLVAETLPDGTLLRYIDVSGVNGLNLAGLAYGPASDGPAFRSLYLVARGVDNAVDPDENDGVLYEVSFPLNIDNLPPFVDAGPTQVLTIGDDASLEGAAADDGNPDPPGALSTTWSQVSGPGVANFADDAALQTTVSFSEDGVYVLRLTADDGELTAFDEVTILVNPPGLVYLPVILRQSP